MKPVKFRRDSGFLARDEFLVIFIKGDHILMSMYIFAIVLLLGTALHCTTWFVWGISSLELIRVNFSITFQNHIMFCRTIIWWVAQVENLPPQHYGATKCQ